jgi:hypothetical protein
MVTIYLGMRHADRVAGIHLNMVVALPEDRHNPDLTGVTPEELGGLMEMQQFLKEETGYQSPHQRDALLGAGGGERLLPSVLRSHARR